MVESHRRLLLVLSAFTTETPRLTLGEVMHATNLPASTGHRLLEHLVAAGVLVKDERKRYTVGDRMWELGIQSPRSRQIRTLVVPVLEQLFLTTRLQVLVAGLACNGQMIVEYTIGRNPGGFFGGVGQRLPLHAVSPGFIALAFGPTGLENTVLSHPLRRFTDSTITEPDELRALVRDVQNAGVAVSHGSFVAGTTSVSAPLFDSLGHFYGAVSVMWEKRAGERDVIPLVMDAAATITNALRRSRV